MAVGHIPYQQNTQHGSLKRQALNDLERGLEGLVDLIAVMDQMKDSGTVGEYLREKFGYADVDAATAAYNELASLHFKLTTNGSVSDVNAALLQAFNKFR
jgi:hypothetical protein